MMLAEKAAIMTMGRLSIPNMVSPAITMKATYEPIM